MIWKVVHELKKLKIFQDFQVQLLHKMLLEAPLGALYENQIVTKQSNWREQVTNDVLRYVEKLQNQFNIKLTIIE